jgi:hypothetical protein
VAPNAGNPRRPVIQPSTSWRPREIDKPFTLPPPCSTLGVCQSRRVRSRVRRDGKILRQTAPPIRAGWTAEHEVMRRAQCRNLRWCIRLARRGRLVSGDLLPRSTVVKSKKSSHSEMACARFRHPCKEAVREDGDVLQYIIPPQLYCRWARAANELERMALLLTDFIPRLHTP